MKYFDKILLIDDNEIFSLMTEEIIEESVVYNNNLVSLNNGQSALDYLKKLHNEIETPDVLIFLDINMPIMDGWAFLDEFAKTEMANSAVVYMLSSSVNREDQDRAKMYDIVRDYITKPVTNEMLEKISADYFS